MRAKGIACGMKRGVGVRKGHVYRKKDAFLNNGYICHPRQLLLLDDSNVMILLQYLLTELWHIHVTCDRVKTPENGLELFIDACPSPKAKASPLAPLSSIRRRRKGKAAY